MARITPLLPAGSTGVLPALPDRRVVPEMDRIPAAAHCGPPEATLPRGRRVSYRKPAPRAALSSRKTDLDQFSDPTTLSPATLLRIIALQTQIAKRMRTPAHTRTPPHD
ncbi:hypothetical protein [Burkholderia sp. Nafp2/4-1b]|uniref:hypothetical protein n=1 Tax=Burkholderia sp. Nafp2/4-1b TaxID=2116686 RepID=UPI001969ADAA|nr:hypothetical protein [Burkholderia sp. Nafp2/4-1b]